MPLQARKNSRSIEVVLEEIDLSAIGQIVAPGVEVVDIDAGRHHVLQILVQALLRCEFSTGREMVVE